jgi:aspartate aminotransferase
VPSQATFFLYPATPGDDFAFTERLAGRGVLVLPAPVFHHRGHFRLSLTARDDMLDRALSVLAEERAR